MKVITTSKAIIIFLIIIAISCAIFHNTQKKEMNIKKEIVKGFTTEATVLSLLGMPTSVLPNNIGDEVWYYKNITYSSQKSDDGKILTLWELATGDSTEVTKPYNLLITVDQNDIVKDFKLDFIDLGNF